MARILVIEDEETIRENIVETLMLNDYEVISASDGIDGLKMANEHRPDLILCDIMMNGMDGYAVLDNLRQTSDIALTPFIFLTARSDRTSLRYGMELGADDYISKPFTTHELLNAVRIRIERYVDIGEQASGDLTQTKQQLAHVISHELRTPLTSINMAVQLMSHQLDFLSTTDIQDLVETLGNGTNRLNRLVEQLTLFVEAKSGLINAEKVKRASRPEALWTLIIGGVNLANHFIYREHNVKVEYDPNFTEIEVSCFRNLMIHAIAEITANAITYSPNDSRVTITVKQFENGVRIRVDDDGKGMTSEQIETALQDFSQVDREKYEQQGMGIGLTLANLIVKSHEGRLDTQSVVGKGTRVDILLPSA